MSDFITAIDPWIEDAAFDAIMHSRQPVTDQIRFVQVIQRKSDSCVIISDCKTQIECTSRRRRRRRRRRRSNDASYDYDAVQDNGDDDDTDAKATRKMPTNIQKGSVAKLENYRFVLLNSTDCNNANKKTRNERDNIGFAIELMTNNSLQFAGAQGMGIIGDPIDLKETVQVRRALQHIRHNVDILKERLSTNVTTSSKPPSTPAAAAAAAAVAAGSADAASSKTNKKKRGDAMALLHQTEQALAQLMREDNDDAGSDDEKDHDNEDDKIETQDLLMTQECKTPLKRKDPAPENGVCSRKKPKKGNALALLRDDVKLERLLGGFDGDGNVDDDDDYETGIVEKRQIQDNDRCASSTGEYVTALKDPAPRPGRINSKRRKATYQLNSQPTRVPEVNIHEHDANDDPFRRQLSALSVGAKENDQELDDDDDCTSDLSDLVGISEMLPSSPTTECESEQQERVLQSNQDRTFPATNSNNTGGQPPLPGGTRITRDDATITAAASRRHRQQLSDAITGTDFMRRWRRTRTFFQKIWEQRHEKEISFS